MTENDDTEKTETVAVDEDKNLIHYEYFSDKEGKKKSKDKIGIFGDEEEQI